MTRMEDFYNAIPSSATCRRDACHADVCGVIMRVMNKNKFLFVTDNVHFRKCNLLDGNG
ncbi:hypothetical protein [Undibacterium sp. TJN19]|uniref:hypothetical protein n=1 Tax=Undibacterium sp. TJN19 TaxID=3413055 RepID=UPI003BF23EA2